MKQSTISLYEQESGLVITACGNDEAKCNTVNLLVGLCDPSRSEIEVSTTGEFENSICEWSAFGEVVSESCYKHFRTILSSGEEIILTFPEIKHDDSKSHLNNVYVFNLGSSAFSIIAHDGIRIEKTKKNFRNKRAVPNHIITLLHALLDSDPIDIREVSISLSQAMHIKETLMAYHHDKVSHDQESLLSESIVQVNSLVSRLEAVKRRLKVKPTFEAVEKSLLIESLKKHMDSIGQSSVFLTLQAQARKQAANITNGNPTTKATPLWEQVKSHKLHDGLKYFFESGAPPPLPVSRCLSCGSKGKLERSTNPKSKKKRFQVACPGCGSQSESSFSNVASGAVVIWNAANASNGVSWPDMSVFKRLPIADKKHSELLKEVGDYIDKYEAYTNVMIKVVDNDKLSKQKEVLGKLQYLKDARVVARQMIKHQKF